jgi:hypothetical protein
MRLWAGLVLPAFALLLCLSAPARAADRFRIGRGPEVFSPDEDVWTTRIGGWFDASYEDNDLSDSTRSINLNHFNVFLDTRYRDTWQVFFEGEYEYESDLVEYLEEREWEVEQAYVRYRRSDALRLRVGRFNTPFGIWTPIHWSILMDTIRAPLHEGLRITPEQQNGFELAGHWLPENLIGGRLELRYSLFAGYGSNGELLKSTDSSGWSGGADFRVLVREDRFLGASYYQQQRDLEPSDRSERNFVLYGQVALPANLLLRAEYVKQLRDRHARPNYPRDIDITYVKLRWHFDPRAYLNYRFNWGDDDTGPTNTVRRIHTWTLGIQPRPWLKLKFEYADHDFRDDVREDFSYWGASIGATF